MIVWGSYGQDVATCSAYQRRHNGAGIWPISHWSRSVFPAQQTIMHLPLVQRCSVDMELDVGGTAYPVGGRICVGRARWPDMGT